MFRRGFAGFALSATLLPVWIPAFAGWGLNGAPFPNAFIQAGDMTLELACDRTRFAPAGYEDARDIERKQGLWIRFQKDEAREAAAFQAGQDNADIRIVDNVPVEIVFHEKADYDFVLDQIGKNAVPNLAMIDGDVSYGIFDLAGSRAAIKSLRAASVSCATGSPGTAWTPDPGRPEILAEAKEAARQNGGFYAGERREGGTGAGAGPGTAVQSANSRPPIARK